MEPDLSVVPFRLAGDDEQTDARNRHLLQAVNADGRAVLSATELDGCLTM